MKLNLPPIRKENPTLKERFDDAFNLISGQSYGRYYVYDKNTKDFEFTIGIADILILPLILDAYPKLVIFICKKQVNRILNNDFKRFLVDMAGAFALFIILSPAILPSLIIRTAVALALTLLSSPIILLVHAIKQRASRKNRDSDQEKKPLITESRDATSPLGSPLVPAAGGHVSSAAVSWRERKDRMLAAVRCNLQAMRFNRP